MASVGAGGRGSAGTGYGPVLHFWRECYGAGAGVHLSLLLVLMDGLGTCSAETKHHRVT